MGSFGVAWLIARNDLRRRLRSRTAILMGVVTPLLMAGLIGLAFGGGMAFTAKITVVDLDGSDVSKGIVEGMTTGVPEDSPVRFVASTDAAAARGALGSGQADAVLIIPNGFGSSVAGLATGAEARSLEVVTDANKRISGDVAQSIADGISARVRASVLAIATAIAASPSPPDATRLQQIIAEGQRVTVPVTVARVDVGSTYNLVAYFGASMGILFLFFTVGTGARSLIAERKEGTLPRVRAAPVTDRAVLLGKSMGVLILGLASLLVIWLVTSVVFHASWGDPVAVLAVLVSVVFAVAGISTLVTGLAKTDAQADGLTSVVAFTFALLGGSFQQPGSLPGVFQKLALLTPNGWALRALTAIGAGGATLATVWPAIVVLLTMGLVTTAFGLRALRAKVLG